MADQNVNVMYRLWIFLFAIIASQVLSAQNFIFDGDGDGMSWSDPANWNTNAVPTDSAYVTIPNGYSVVLDGPTDVLLNDLFVVEGGELTIPDSVVLRLVNFVDGGDTRYPINVEGLLINHGTILAENLIHLVMQVNVTGIFRNHGLVDVQHISPSTNQNAIFFNNNVIENYETGRFRFFDIGRWSLDNRDSLINDGEWYVDSMSKRTFVNEGYVENNGLMVFKRLGPVGNDVAIVQVGASQGFHNYGTIKLLELNRGIQFLNDTFYNHVNARIIADEIYNSSIVSDNNTGTFINDGSIKVSNAFDGIYIIKGDFVNAGSGKIHIEKTERFGLGVVSGNEFLNEGRLQIYQTNEAGIVTSISADFINKGTVDIDPEGNVSVDNGVNCIFSNLECATMLLGDSIKNQGTFINDAYMKRSSSLRLANGNLFHNSGIIEGNDDFAAAVSTNTGYIFVPPVGVDQVGETFTSFYEGTGTGVSITSSDLRLSESINSPIGISFDMTSSLWGVECDAVGRFAFYFEAQRGACPVQTMTTSLESAVSSLGPNLNTWTGIVNQFWETAGNWTTNTVPSGCDSVVISSGTTVFIQDMAVASNVTLTNNSELRITGSLFLSGNNDYALKVESSELDLSGDLSIKVSTGKGIVLEGGAGMAVNALGVLDIENLMASSQGIYIGPTDILANSGTIHLGGNSLSRGILNEGDLINQAVGEIFAENVVENRFASAEIINRGYFSIRDFDHDQDAFLNNEACGRLIFRDIIWRATAENYGIIKFEEKYGPNNILFAGVISNYGIIEDYKEKNTYALIFNNPGVSLTQLNQHLAVGLSYPINFTDLPFEFSDIFYLDRDFCIPVATYDESTKLIVPNKDAAGITRLCMEIISDEGCIDTFCVDLDVPILGETCASGSLEQLNTLINIYDSLDGPNWSNRLGWNNGKAGIDCDLCNWYGVQCDPSGEYVIGLVLPSNNLNGTMPQAWGNLDSLKFLDFSSNMIEGTLPASFSSLTELQQIDLADCMLSGSVPASWNSLMDLTEIELSNNDLSGPLPDIFQDLTHLQTLSLRNNSVEGKLPETLGFLDNLVVLDFLNNDFSDCWPASWLNLCDNGLSAQLGGNNLPGNGDLNAMCTSEFGICHNPLDCTSVGDELRFVPNSSLLPWHFHSLWDLGRAPDYCDHVILEPNKLVVIENGILARCKSIEVQLGASLTGDGELEVTGN